jgi:hypothetical protein
MARVFKVVRNARGALIGYNELPLQFDAAAESIKFMNWYVAVFAGGRCGYQRQDRYWWGCDESSD